MTAANTAVRGPIPLQADGPARRQRSSRTDTFKFDRRRWPRAGAAGDATVVYTDGQDRVGVTSLRLHDRSALGLGAWTPSPLEPGMRLTIHATEGGLGWTSARVVRASKAGDDADGWFVGVSLDPADPPKAA